MAPSFVAPTTVDAFGLISALKTDDWKLNEFCKDGRWKSLLIVADNAAVNKKIAKHLIVETKRRQSAIHITITTLLAHIFMDSRVTAFLCMGLLSYLPYYFLIADCAANRFERLLVAVAPCQAHLLSSATRWGLTSRFKFGALLGLVHVI